MVGTLGFVGAQTSHKGTGMIEIGSKVSLIRFSFKTWLSGELVGGAGRFTAEVFGDTELTVNIFPVAGGVVWTGGAPGSGGCGPGGAPDFVDSPADSFFSNMRNLNRAIAVIHSSHLSRRGLRPFE